MKRYKSKICDICLVTYNPTSGIQKRCGVICKRVAKKRYDKKRKGVVGRKEVRYIIAKDFRQLVLPKIVLRGVY